ncbi:MAG: YceI family protein [Bdellovibrionota bacterium]
MNFNIKTAVICAALLSSLSVYADKKAKAGIDMMQTYKMDVKESSINWTGSKKIGKTHTGAVSFKDGNIELKKGEIVGGTFKVDMATLSNADLADSAEYQKKLEGHLKSADFFNVDKFPESTFKISKIEKKSDKEIVVKGDLTMIGVTKPLEFPATMSMEKDILKGEAKVKIDRTKWGLKYGSGDFFKELTGDKIINNEFELNLKIVAKK